MANLKTSGVFNLGSLSADGENIVDDSGLNDVVLLLDGFSTTDVTGLSTVTPSASGYTTNNTTGAKFNQYIDLQNNPAGYFNVAFQSALGVSNEPFTVETWVYFDAISNDGVFQLYQGTSKLDGTVVNHPDSIAVAVSSSGWTFYEYSGLNNGLGNSATGNWYHVAVVYDNTNLSFYVDGVLLRTAAKSMPAGGWTSIGIGGYYTTTYLMDGRIEGFRVTKGVARYTANFTPPTSALSADVSGITGSDDVVLLLDGSSDTTDASGNQTISETGTVTPVTATGHPYATSSLDFDTSVTSYLRTGTTTDFKFGTDPFTIEFWMKPDTLNTSASNASYSCIMENESGSTVTGSWFVVHQINGEIYFGVNSGTTSITTSGSGISTTSWSHVAIVRSSSNICTIYVNGVSKGSVTLSNDLTDANSRTLVIGKQLVAARRYDGQLTDIRITKGAALYPFHLPIAAFPTTTTYTGPTRPTRRWGGITGRSLISNDNVPSTGVLTLAEHYQFQLGSPSLVVATGGTYVEHDGYSYNVFYFDTSSTTQQTLTIPTTLTNFVEILMVAGGGGGGFSIASGGGAGGLVEATLPGLNAGTYTITVGGGGAGGIAGTQTEPELSAGEPGGNTTFTGGTLSLPTANGGGGGGSYNNVAGEDGGSGGGTANSSAGASNQTGTAYGNSIVIAYGNDGTIGTGNITQGPYFPGAGGGAGGDAPAAVTSGPTSGGVGRAVSWLPTSLNTALTTAIGEESGGSLYFAGGGGGSGTTSSIGGAGGLGGGGTGSFASADAEDGQAHTGGGGGGGDVQFRGKYPGVGASGIVVIRYSN